MMAAKPEERGRRPRSCSSTSARPRPRTSTLKADPTRHRGQHAAPTRAATRALQKKAVEFVGGAKPISQFLDRDTRPDFASTVMIPAIQKFIKTPNDIDGLHQEHREPEEDDLHRPERRAMTAQTDRRPPAGHRPGRRPHARLRPQEPGAQARRAATWSSSR